MFRRRALRRRLAALGVAAVPEDVVRRLARALDAGGGGGGALCVPCDDRRLRLALARAFCFPELRDLVELRRMPHCTEPTCCNPHHYSRLCKPETPPPPYSRFAMEDYKSKDAESTEDARRTDHERLETGSIATDGEERQSWETEWCRLAYWELTQRVGRQFGVRMRAVDVFGGGGGACGSGRHGLCLDALHHDNQQPDQVRKTRAKIGLGVTLSLECDGVWVYNRGAEPVFVSSPALDAAPARALLVWRVAANHCLRVFPPPPFAALAPAPSRAPCPSPAPAPAPHGPRDPRSVRISFAKGWGPKYSRRDVTACPCWLEVLLAPPS